MQCQTTTRLGGEKAKARLMKMTVQLETTHVNAKGTGRSDKRSNGKQSKLHGI